jgi:CheY-like chemotaxis protein
MRVLVVDDDLDTLDLFATLLGLWGHEVRVLENPTRALSAALEFLPDLVFLDLGMPEVDGWQVAKQMRQHKVLESTFLVAVTGYGREEDRAKSHAAGFDVHLLKPVDTADLQLLLKRRPHPAPRPRLTPPGPQSSFPPRRPAGKVGVQKNALGPLPA